MDRKINKEVIEKLVEKQCTDNDYIDFVDLIDDALEINVYDDLVYVFTRVEIPIPSDIRLSV